MLTVRIHLRFNQTTAKLQLVLFLVLFRLICTESQAFQVLSTDQKKNLLAKLL